MFCNTILKVRQNRLNSTAKAFTPLEKATDKVGGNYLGEDGGLKPEADPPLAEMPPSAPLEIESRRNSLFLTGSAHTAHPVRKEFSNRVKERSSLTGFTLIEIMVVLAIILILVTLVIPNILRLRINSNEIAAVSNLNTLGKSVQQYYMQNGYKYPQNLTDLTSPNSNPPYITQELASGSFSGYLYSYASADNDKFYIKANPRTRGSTGVRYFYLDETGVIRYNLEQEAGANDPPVK